MEDKTITIMKLIVDSEGKLVGLAGDEREEGCPVAFAPTEDLVGATRLALLQGASREHEYTGVTGIFQLSLERMEKAWVILNKLLEEEKEDTLTSLKD